MNSEQFTEIIEKQCLDYLKIKGTVGDFNRQLIASILNAVIAMKDDKGMINAQSLWDILINL